MVSPDLLSLNFTCLDPALGLLSAQNWTKPFAPAPMNERGGMGDIVFFVRSSVKKKPPSDTGFVPLL
jgi:hypothetical protein